MSSWPTLNNPALNRNSCRSLLLVNKGLSYVLPSCKRLAILKCDFALLTCEISQCCASPHVSMLRKNFLV